MFPEVIPRRDLPGAPNAGGRAKIAGFRVAARESTNDLLRSAIARVIRLGGGCLEALHWLVILRYQQSQYRLRKRLRIRNHTRVSGFSPEVEKQLEQGSGARTGVRTALSSGTTGHPKRVPVTPRRLRGLRWTFMDMFARLAWARRLRDTTLYLFSNDAQDSSLTALLMEESGTIPYLASLQAPYRLESNPHIKELIEDYGVLAVRFWLILLCNPGVFYATNPSTLSTFFDRIQSQWGESRRLVCDFLRAPHRFPRQVHAVAARIRSRGSESRMRRVAGARKPLPVKLWNPRLAAYICWTGGYVAPFLQRLQRQLGSRVAQVPMYSMSTESLLTVSHFEPGGVSQLPLGRGILYEFIPSEAADLEENLLCPHQLRAGCIYSMVVSDRFGLRRYQTDDLFQCHEKVRGIPRLTFLRRRGLNYSLTGEKLTAEQVQIGFEQLREQWPELRDGHLACVPSMPAGEAVPHYLLTWVVNIPGSEDTTLDLPNVARSLDEVLCELNPEYQSKRQSHRLAPPRAIRLSTGAFIQKLTPPALASSGDQFKFLPLYPRLWEDEG